MATIIIITPPPEQRQKSDMTEHDVHFVNCDPDDFGENSIQDAITGEQES